MKVYFENGVFNMMKLKKLSFQYQIYNSFIFDF